MNAKLKMTADAILRRTTTSVPGVPGVAAVATDRNGNIYEGAAGKLALGREAEMRLDSVCAIFSATKAVAGTAALQLVEEGRLDLDAPAKNYAPDIAKIRVSEGFDRAGGPKLRPPKRDITTRMLLLHTAGFSYDFTNETYARLAKEHGQLSPLVANKACLQAPLLFDPGEEWEYGINMDWAGQVVEGASGRRLGELFRGRIFDPLEIVDTAFSLTPEMRARRAFVHERRADGGLTLRDDLELPPEPEVHMAGHGLYGTAADYIKFIRMWLNDGMGPNGRVLKKETVEMAEKDGLGGMKIKPLPAVNPELTNPAEFFPGMPKSWALTFMVNDEDAPTGRPAGSLAWAGLANLYYWIDRKNGVGGFWATQILPFADPTSVGGYLDFETAVYDCAVKAAS